MIKLTTRDYISIPFIYISITIMQFAYFIATEWGKEAIDDIFIKNVLKPKANEKEMKG